MRPGTFVVSLAARADGPIAELARHAPEGTWREGEEVWCFEPREDLRIVTLEVPDYPEHPEINYSVKYTHGPGHKPEAPLAPGGKVKVKNGMVFSVSETGQS